MRYRVFMLGVLAAFSCSLATGAVIFDNTNLALNGLQLVSPNDWWAEKFSTPVTERLITDVELLLRTDGTGTWDFDVAIYSSVSDEPGSLITVLHSETTTVPFNSPFQITGLSTLLDPSTDYFLAITPKAGSANLLWQYASSSETGRNGESNDQGGSWSMADTAPQQMAITAVVPEPSAVVLAIGGVAGLGLFRVRRRFVSRQ